MKIEISQKAQKELQKRDVPLIVELELYFSCLIRKRVHFHNEPLQDGIHIGSQKDNLMVQFRPVMTKACLVGDSDINDPAVERFPIKRAERFYPKWLRVDFSMGKWYGEFGYTHK